jgi:outer membrane lipoprotein-sorting protein
MHPSRALIAFGLLVLLTGETGCLFHTRTAEIRTSTAKLQTATKLELLERIHTEAARIKTLNATVDIATSVGGEKKGTVTDYQEIRGYILVRKPNMLRMIGLFPIVRNKAFDMVSDGDRFKLYVPAKNKFYVGSDQVVHPAANPLENLRPQVIYNALLLPDIDPQSDIAVLEDSIEVIYDVKKKRNLEQPDYVIDIIHHAGNDWYLARKVVFNRTNLVPHQQIIYDQKGAIATEATYQAYQDYNGISFPSVIQINRPQEEYSIRLTIVKLEINQPMRDDQFVLEQPPGSQLADLDQPNQTAPSSPPSAASPSSNSPPKK